MKFTFLGTAAAEGFPALWCECDTCKAALKRGGRDLRRRCSYLIDDDTLIDFGPDIYWQMRDFQIDWSNLKRVVITHNHADHLSPLEFLWRYSAMFSKTERELTVIGSKRIFSRILSFAAEDSGIYDLASLQIRPLEISHGETVKDRDMKITAFKADHAPGKEAQVFLLERAGKHVFIGNDTGMLPEESWERLTNIKLDLAVIDATMGLKGRFWRNGHLGVETAVEFRDRLARLGCITESTEVYVSHFSHNGGNLHADLEAFFEPHHIKVASDGATLLI